MLIEFRVENYRSLCDEQAITMEAGRIGDPADPRPRDVPGHGEKLLPAAVLYGANASGKSNVLGALTFMREAVVLSHREWEPAGGVPRTSFAWGGKRNESSVFETTFLLEGTKYEYGFSVDDEVVQEEWLYAWPKSRKQVWFEREGNRFRFGEHLDGPNNAVREVTRPNALFLSAAAQHGHRLLMPVYGWFLSVIPVNTPHRRHSTRMLAYWDYDDTLAVRIRALLKAADTGIVDMRKSDIERQRRDRRISKQQVLLQHQDGDDDSWIELQEESAGTKALFQMAPSVFRVLDSGGLLVVDELESSLHPLLALTIVKMFNNPETNPHNAQIVFATHDTNLLGTILGETPLRRDQIWFTEKDSEGTTKLYPLTDYRPRKSENLERGYLQGRYGAIPFLGDNAWITE